MVGTYIAGGFVTTGTETDNESDILKLVFVAIKSLDIGDLICIIRLLFATV